MLGGMLMLMANANAGVCVFVCACRGRRILSTPRSTKRRSKEPHRKTYLTSAGVNRRRETLNGPQLCVFECF